jgi:oligopeptidase B
MVTPIAKTNRQYWQDYYLPDSGTLLLGIYLFKNYLIRSERIKGLPKIIVMQDFQIANQAKEYAIEFPEQAYELNIIGGFEFDTNNLRFNYSSMTTPSQVFDFNMQNQQRELRKQQEVPSGHTAADYITRRIFAETQDGVQIPISILYHRDTPLDGTAPLLLYGYGSYGATMPASFATSRLSLVNRGFIYAIAHIRGGMELGYHWYTSGKLNHKKNTFNDFICAANYLIDQNYTAKGNITIHGGSAGGMLIGACINQAPDLFHAAVADVPFVDVLNTMCDESLPLTPAEWPEWGNPNISKDDYDYIKSYSPYDQVCAQNYPHLLVTAGLTDPRVTYWEPAKWVAKLRAMKTDQNTLLLKTNMEAGHAGASGRFDRLKEVALMYAFILKVYKMTDTDDIYSMEMTE